MLMDNIFFDDCFIQNSWRLFYQRWLISWSFSMTIKVCLCMTVFLDICLSKIVNFMIVLDDYRGLLIDDHFSWRLFYRESLISWSFSMIIKGCLWMIVLLIIVFSLHDRQLIVDGIDGSLIWNLTMLVAFLDGFIENR